nr:hypothetical protein Q903MT_gene1723 [Picea sitchensis]
MFPLILLGVMRDNIAMFHSLPESAFRQDYLTTFPLPLPLVHEVKLTWFG